MISAVLDVWLGRPYTVNQSINHLFDSGRGP